MRWLSDEYMLDIVAFLPMAFLAKSLSLVNRRLHRIASPMLYVYNKRIAGPLVFGYRKKRPIHERTRTSFFSTSSMPSGNADKNDATYELYDLNHVESPIPQVCPPPNIVQLDDVYLKWPPEDVLNTAANNMPNLLNDPTLLNFLEAIMAHESARKCSINLHHHFAFDLFILCNSDTVLNNLFGKFNGMLTISLKLFDGFYRKSENGAKLMRDATERLLQLPTVMAHCQSFWVHYCGDSAAFPAVSFANWLLHTTNSANDHCRKRSMDICCAFLAESDKRESYGLQKLIEFINLIKEPFINDHIARQFTVKFHGFKAPANFTLSLRNHLVNDVLQLGTLQEFPDISVVRRFPANTVELFEPIDGLGSDERYWLKQLKYGDYYDEQEEEDDIILRVHFFSWNFDNPRKDE